MSLPPGFRFHPTDVELIMYYLKRKSLGKKLLFDTIAEVDFYKYSPWDLPVKSCLKNKDLEWFFFCPISRKYASGSRFGRATETGYWKATGKDRSIMHKEETVGMIKTLVFHQGQAPKGERTDWVMHEYRILEKGLANAGVESAAYVLVKLFKKSGLGPKNGAQYGAPFNEEEWADDDDDEIVNNAPTFQPSVAFPSSAIANNNNHSVVTSTHTHGSTSSASLQPLSVITGDAIENYAAAAFQPSEMFLSSTLANNNHHSIVTSTHTRGNTSGASLQPLSVIAHNSSSYSVDTAPQSASRPLTAMEPNHSNSIGSCSHGPPADPLLALANNNYSLTTNTFFHGSTSTGLVPGSGPPTEGSLANKPDAGDIDIDSMLDMFTEDDDFLNIPLDLDAIQQMDGGEFLEMNDIFFTHLDDFTGWK